MSTGSRTLFTSGRGHCVRGLMHECGSPSLWSFLLAPETGAMVGTGLPQQGGVGGTVSLSLLHPSGLPVREEREVLLRLWTSATFSNLVCQGVLHRSSPADNKVVLDFPTRHDCWGG